MKNIKKLFFILIISLFFPLNTLAFSFKLNSNNIILINLNEDKVIYEQNSTSKTSIASLTKIMTAVIVLENIDSLDEKVLLIKEDFNNLAKYDAKLSGLIVNHYYTYEELLYGLLLPSGADCATSLARLVANDIPSFVNLMNEKAKELGMVNTKFANPIGLDDKNNYSTVYDVSLLFKYALTNETFKKIITTMEYETSDHVKLNHTITDYAKTYSLKIENILGGKTGNETNSGYCLASISSFNNINYMLITTNSKSKTGHLEDAINLYKYYIDNYNYQLFYEKDSIIYQINTKYSKKNKINIYAKEDYSYYLENNYDKEKITKEYLGVEEVSYKNKKHSKLGVLNIYYDNVLLDKIDIYLEENVTFNLICYFKENHSYFYLSIIIILLVILLIILLIKRRKIKKKLNYV